MPKLRGPDDLAGHNCLTYWMGPDDVVWKFMRKSRLREIAVPSSFSSNNGIILCDLAVRGHGIALLDDYTVADEVKGGRLVRLLPGHTANPRGRPPANRYAKLFAVAAELGAVVVLLPPRVGNDDTDPVPPAVA